MNELTNEELAALIQITEAAAIQGKNAHFIANLLDKLRKASNANA